MEYKVESSLSSNRSNRSYNSETYNTKYMYVYMCIYIYIIIIIYFYVNYMQQKSYLQAQTSAGLLLQGGGGIGTTRIMSVQNPLVKLSSLRVTGENK